MFPSRESAFEALPFLFSQANFNQGSSMQRTHLGQMILVWPISSMGPRANIQVQQHSRK